VLDDKPNALVLDMSVLRRKSPDSLRKLKARFPSMGMIVISERKDVPAITASLMSGAEGYLLKPVARRLLEDAVKRVVQGQMAFSAEIFLQILATFNPRIGLLPECKLLSRRERQILTYLAMDYQHKEIAALLSISENTVHWHVQRICKKLRADNATAALRKFLGSGLFPAFNSEGPDTQPAPSTVLIRSLGKFERRFATDEACSAYLAALRWPDGFRCPECSGRRGWQSSRGLWLCAQCRRQVSVTSGTIFHETHLPLPLWFRIIWEFAMQNRLTPADLLRTVRLGGYKTAWTCVNKLRRCLGESNCLGNGGLSHCGERFECIMRRALETSPHPLKKLCMRPGR
jgi:DNA-binding NarL/FixJ family response regulator